MKTMTFGEFYAAVLALLGRDIDWRIDVSCWSFSHAKDDAPEVVWQLYRSTSGKGNLSGPTAEIVLEKLRLDMREVETVQAPADVGEVEV